MYQLHVTVREYMGTIGVSGVLSDTDDLGVTRQIAHSQERFFQPSEACQDPLSECYRALIAWARITE